VLVFFGPQSPPENLIKNGQMFFLYCEGLGGEGKQNKIVLVASYIIFANRYF
jgi:hypothetical protein